MKMITISEEQLHVLETRIEAHGKQIAEMQVRIDALEIQIEQVKKSQKDLCVVPRGEIFAKEKSNTLKADDHE